jgi:hypothetical protein
VFGRDTSIRAIAFVQEEAVVGVLGVLFPTGEIATLIQELGYTL